MILFYDLEDELCLIINDAEWRSDKVGKKVISDPVLLDLLAKYLNVLNENNEIIFVEATTLHFYPTLALMLYLKVEEKFGLEYNII